MAERVYVISARSGSVARLTAADQASHFDIEGVRGVRLHGRLTFNDLDEAEFTGGTSRYAAVQDEV